MSCYPAEHSCKRSERGYEPGAGLVRANQASSVFLAPRVLLAPKVSIAKRPSIGIVHPLARDPLAHHCLRSLHD
jgi:hypothetical protein